MFIKVMKTELQFNICKLETSCIHNDDIPDLSMRLTNAVSTHLFYACRFWANHLQALTFDLVILDDVKYFLYNSLLHWLEVMSLTKQVNRALVVLSSVVKWTKVSD